MKFKFGSVTVTVAAVLIGVLVFASLVWGDISTTTVEKARDATVLVATRNENNQMGNGFGTVSYTHLTLPTIYSV